MKEVLVTENKISNAIESPVSDSAVRPSRRKNTVQRTHSEVLSSFDLSNP